MIVGRIKPRYQKSITSALAFLNSKIGVGYDDEFLLNNKLYYCSELIYESFINDSIFSLNKMTFLNPENNDTLSTWKEYYKNLKMKIPEGKPGINPGIMSLSEKIDIIHFYGNPSKKQ